MDVCVRETRAGAMQMLESVGAGVYAIGTERNVLHSTRAIISSRQDRQQGGGGDITHLGLGDGSSEEFVRQQVDEVAVA